MIINVCLEDIFRKTDMWLVCVTFGSFRIIKVPKYSSCIKHDCLVRNYCKLMSESYAEVSDEEAKQKYVGYCKKVA